MAPWLRAVAAARLLNGAAGLRGGALRCARASSSSSAASDERRRYQAILGGDGSPLRNEYVALRHGWSRANAAGVIVSRIGDGAKAEWGLHENGAVQAAAAVGALRAIAGDRPVVILSSDFARARETADIVAKGLGAAVRDEPRLRERDFGDLELCAAAGGYEGVWADDAADSGSAARGVEPVDAVLARGAAAVRDVEAARTGACVVLASHGDCLQILQTAFAGVDPRTHRSLPHLDTAAPRRLLVAEWETVADDEY